MDVMMKNEQFKKNVIDILGDRGMAWLDQLPDLVHKLSSQWQLTDIKVFENLSYNYVARAYSNYYQSAVVLKICLPEKTFMHEVHVLNYYNGIGCVRLLHYNEEHKAQLLEAIEPGTVLKELFPEHDQQAVEIAVNVMKLLHREPIQSSHAFITIQEWFSLFDSLTIPDALKSHVERACKIAKQLRITQHDLYLLHGDLHHENILKKGSSEWIAIDPKGVLGELAYEVGPFISNPLNLFENNSVEAVKNIIEQRIELFSRLLCIDRQRIIDASYARIVLSVCWTVADGLDWKNSDDLKCLEILLLL
jgi:streptomycin 6-kinase